MTDEPVPGSSAADPSEPVAPASADPFAGPGWDETTTRATSRPHESVAGVEGDGEVRVRRERRRRSKYTRRRRRRRILVSCSVLVLAVLAGIAWLVYSGLQARRDLEAVRSEVRQLRSQIASGDLSGARTTAAQLRGHANDAHAKTTGPLWSTAAAIPWLGAPLDSARTITTSVDQVAGSALPDLVDASQGIDPSNVRRSDGSVDLSAISAVTPQISSASSSLHAAVRHITAAPSATWLGSVNKARADLLGQVTGLSTTVDSAAVAVRVVPSMLGASGVKNYMVTFQNEAELRGTGGLPGAFAILQVDNGKFHFSRFESDTLLVNQRTSLDFGPQFNQMWVGSNPTTDYRDSNVSPNFPYAAQVWLAEWQAKTGQQLDGAITLDPTAVSYLLKVAGSVTLPDGTKITAANVVSLTQNQAYVRFGDRVSRRKKFLLQVAQSVSRKLIGTHGDTTALVRAAADAASQYRLLVWSRDPAVERLLAPTKISGVIPDTAAPYAGLAMNNAAANKLDYYTEASMDIARAGCGLTRTTTVTMRFTNKAPDNLTPYMNGTYGRPNYPPNKGDNRTEISYYATKGAQMTSITIDGKTAGATPGFERGHPTFTIILGLPRGVTQTVVLHLSEPDGQGPLTVRPQPLVQPMRVNVDDRSCGS